MIKQKEQQKIIDKTQLVINNLTPSKAKTLFLLDYQRAVYMSNLWSLLNHQSRNIKQINILIQILNVTALLNYRQKLKPKNYNQVLKQMKIEAYQKGKTLIQSGEVCKQLKILICGKVQIKVQRKTHYQEQDQVAQALTKIVTQDKLNQVALTNRTHLSLSTITILEPSVFLTIGFQSFQKNLLKIEMSEQNQILQFFRGFHFMMNLSTQRLRNIINQMSQFLTFKRGQVLLYQNQENKNIVMVYSGSLVVQQPIYKDQYSHKKFIKVSEISYQQVYGFQTLCKQKPQRLSVNSQHATVFVIATNKLVAQAPQIKSFIQGRTINNMIQLRQNRFVKQLQIQKLKRKADSSNLYQMDRKSMPQFQIPMLIDPKTLQVQSGFVRKESVPIRIRTKYTQVLNKFVKKTNRLNCTSCKQNLSQTKCILNQKGSKLIKLKKCVRKVNNQRDGFDYIFKNINLSQTKLRSINKPEKYIF